MLDYWVLAVLHWIPVPLGIYAFIHAAMQRADAFTATDRLTKPAWMGITGGGTAALLLFSPTNVSMLFWLAGLIAVLVYMVDVKPTVTEVQRGPRW